MWNLSEHPKLLIVLVVINIPVYYYVGKSYYKTWEDFTEALRYLFQPGWLSAARGEFSEDFWETLKLYLYFATCAAVVVIQYKIFS
jgi:hypothetical protein